MRFTESFREFVVVAMVWLLAIFLPLMITDTKTKIEWWFWVVITLLMGIFTFDGVRAWHRGIRAPLAVKVFVPIGLLAISFTLLWVGIWDRFRSYIFSLA